MAGWDQEEGEVPPDSAAIISTSTLSRAIVLARQTIMTILITIAIVVEEETIPAGVTRPIGATLCTSCDRIRAVHLPITTTAAVLSCLGLRFSRARSGASGN